MPPNASLQLLIMLSISIPVQSQFEFNDLPVIPEILADAVKIKRISCVVILRPPDQSPKQKFAIDKLTVSLTKAFSHKSSVMSYTTESYVKFYDEQDKRKKDACIYWLTVVMVSNSTKQQLAYVS